MEVPNAEGPSVLLGSFIISLFPGKEFCDRERGVIDIVCELEKIVMILPGVDRQDCVWSGFDSFVLAFSEIEVFDVFGKMYFQLDSSASLRDSSDIQQEW